MHLINGDQFLLECLKAWLRDSIPSPELLEGAKSSPNGLVTSDGALAPVLNYLLSSWGVIGNFSHEQREYLRKRRHFVAANNAVFLKELDLFLHESRRENIVVLLLKGLALIKMGVYPKLGLRFLSDMDVLVRKDDVPRLESVLDSAGWKSEEKANDIYSAHHLPIRYSPRGFPLEVHFALSRVQLDVDMEEIWERSTILEGAPMARIPSIEDTVFMLALNASLHHPDRIGPLQFKFAVDFSFVWNYTRGHLDWEYLAVMAERAGASAPFWNAMSIVQTLLQPPGCAELFARFGVESKVDSSFVKRVAGRVMKGRRSGDLNWLVVLAAEETNPLRRLWRVIKVVFPPPSVIREVYPEWNRPPWVYFAYLARIFRAARNFNWRKFVMAYRTGKASRRAGAMRD